MVMDNIATESQLFALHMNLVHLSRLFSERSLNLSDTVKVDSGTLENSPIEIHGKVKKKSLQRYYILVMIVLIK